MTSLTSLAVVRYLKWLSIPAKTFNVGNYRRTATPQPTADFFSMGNSEGERLRHAAAEAAVKDMVAWFERGEILFAIGAGDDSWNTLERVSYVWIKDTWVAYPFQNNIAALPKEDQVRVWLAAVHVMAALQQLSVRIAPKSG